MPYGLLFARKWSRLRLLSKTPRDFETIRFVAIVKKEVVIFLKLSEILEPKNVLAGVCFCGIKFSRIKSEIREICEN